MNVNSGRLRHPVELQQYTVTEDAVGNQHMEWHTVQRIWAAVNSLHGQEYWAAAAQGQQNTLVFVLRYSPLLGQLTAGGDLTRWRLLFDGRAYAIKSVDDLEFRHQVVKLKGVLV